MIDKIIDIATWIFGIFIVLSFIVSVVGYLFWKRKNGSWYGQGYGKK